MTLLSTLRTGVAAGLLLMATFAPSLAQASADGVRCAYTKRMICTTEGCGESDIGSSHLVVPPLPALQHAIQSASPIHIQRCDARGCAPVEITDAGAAGFLTLSGQRGAYMIKVYAGPDIDGIELRTGDFIEVVTSMMTTWVAYGSCAEPQP